MATIYDVAKRAGVSPKTVSRVLNGDGPVKDGTRRAVTDAMSELGYVPSLAARSIKSNKSGLIGMITGAISTAQTDAASGGLPELQLVQGVQNVISGSGKTLLISDTGGSEDRVPELIRTFREHRVEGLLYVSDYHKRLATSLPVHDVTTVLVNCFDDAGTPSVLPDDKEGQLALTRAVIAAGHKRIAYLSLSPAQEATKLRLKGFRQALEEAGIEFEPELIAPTDLFGTPGEHKLISEALDRFLSNANPPTVVCCGNDRLALAVYGILRSRGIAVPDQMSVAGYDDHRVISETLFPALTTAELPYNAMGARAARLLLDLMSSPNALNPSEPILIGGQVAIRGSVASTPDAEPAFFDNQGRINS